MSDRIWVVKQRASDSYDGYTDSYETVSLHRTEEGAKKKAEILKKDNAVYSLSGGGAEDHEADVDSIVGAVEANNSELGEDLRQRLAKPGAELMSVVFKLMEDHGISYADTKVSSQLLNE